MKGELQRFQRVGIEEEEHDADEGGAVFVAPGRFVKVAGNYHLAVMSL